MKETKNSYRRRFLPAHSVWQEISPEINAQVTAFVHLMREQHLEGVTDVIPAFHKPSHQLRSAGH